MQDVVIILLERSRTEMAQTDYKNVHINFTLRQRFIIKTLRARWSDSHNIYDSLCTCTGTFV